MLSEGRLLRRRGCNQLAGMLQGRQVRSCDCGMSYRYSVEKTCMTNPCKRAPTFNVVSTSEFWR